MRNDGSHAYAKKKEMSKGGIISCYSHSPCPQCSPACLRKRRIVASNDTPHTAYNLAPPENDSYSFCNPFIAFAIAKLDLAITCRLSLVTSGSACISLSLSACSLNSRK